VCTFTLTIEFSTQPAQQWKCTFTFTIESSRQLPMEVHFQGYNRVLNIITMTVDVHFQGYNRVPQPAASMSFLLPIDTETNQPPTRRALSPLQSSPQHSHHNNGGTLSPLQSSPQHHSLPHSDFQVPDISKNCKYTHSAQHATKSAIH